MKNPDSTHCGTSGEGHLRTFLAVLAVLLLLGCHSNERKQPFSAEDYLAQRDDISEELRAAIINRKVVVGMFPDEAHAAAGAFIYNVKPDPKWGDSYYPLDIIFGQRHRPDSSQITMTFQNTTQFDSSEPVRFCVHFENGQAIRIERLEPPDP